MTKADKNGKVNHLTGKQYAKIVAKIEANKAITERERELLECMLFDNHYVWDSDQYFDSNWAYIHSIKPSKLIEEIEKIKQLLSMIQ